jgi:restriction endonuclease
MKLHFESNLDYQLTAIESVCDLFRGQEICRTEFTVTREFGGGQAPLAGLENDLGIGNRLTLLDDEILREGWDNPNVFQICALREMGTERERRQTIGRGLRLCVNQQGERLRGFDFNTLTVIATESYEEFAENLQKEIETDTGIHFGIVEKHQFASIPVADEAGRTRALGVQQSEAIWNHLTDRKRAAE